MLNRQEYPGFSAVQKPFVDQIKLASSLSLSFLLVACGGGTSDTHTSSARNTVSDEVALSSAIAPEVRDGNTVSDGLSAHGDLELGAALGSETIESDSCVTSTADVENASELVSENVSVVSVEPESQSGLQAYDTETRLSFESSSVFGNLNTSDAAPLMPLVWVAPESGVLSASATSLRWEASFNNEALIRLRLSTIDLSDAENPEVITIACRLVDDGLFTLPADFQEQLPAQHAGISVYAVRERVPQLNSDDAQLTVVQWNQP